LVKGLGVEQVVDPFSSRKLLARVLPRDPLGAAPSARLLAEPLQLCYLI
jgi:hypothetical protein